MLLAQQLSFYLLPDDSGLEFYAYKCNYLPSVKTLLLESICTVELAGLLLDSTVKFCINTVNPYCNGSFTLFRPA